MERFYKATIRATLITAIFFFLEARAENTLSSVETQQVEKRASFLTEVDQIVNEALQTFKVPGTSISIVVGGETIFSKGYGTRKVGEKLPVTERTLFPIASCTKAFTALILGQLVDEGKVDLDDPVKKHIPEFILSNEELTANVTIRDLLAHRSGIERHDVLWFFSKPSKDTLLASLQHLDPVWTLREKFEYSNIMYAVAGMVIERITGQSWEDAVASRLLIPLQMSDSNTSVEQLLISNDYTVPHTEINGTIQQLPFCNCSPVNPGAGINSNALDMAKWAALHLSNGTFLGQEVISTTSLNEQHTIQISINSPAQVISQSGYGLGWFIGDYRGYNWISHSGHIDGISSDTSLLPSENFGLVILTNSGDEGHFFISAVRNQIIDRFLGINKVDWTGTSQYARDYHKLGVNKALVNFQEMSLAPQPLDTLQYFAGRYEHPAYGPLQIRMEEGHLAADFSTASIPLYFKYENVFTGQFRELLAFGIDPAVDFIFSKNSSGAIDKVQVPFESFRKAQPVTFQKN